MVQYKEAKNPAGMKETVLDEPTRSYRERIATQAKPGRGRWEHGRHMQPVPCWC